MRVWRRGFVVRLLSKNGAGAMLRSSRWHRSCISADEWEIMMARQRDPIVHQLTEFEDSGYLPSLEYLLPCEADLSNLDSRSAEWVGSFAKLSQPLLRDAWIAHLESRATPTTQALVDNYLEFEIRSMSRTDLKRGCCATRHPMTCAAQILRFSMPHPPMTN